MSFVKLEPQPERRDPEVPFEEIAPGLYLDETAVQLDSGELVAVSIEDVAWLENGAGVSMVGVARVIAADGSTAGYLPGQHLETRISYTAGAVDIASFGLPALQREVLFAVLGEPLTMVERTNPPPADPANPPPGWTETFEAPMIPWGEEVLLNASIRRALVNAAAAATPPDVGSILGL